MIRCFRVYGFRVYFFPKLVGFWDVLIVRIRGILEYSRGLGFRA